VLNKGVFVQEEDQDHLKIWDYPNSMNGVEIDELAKSHE
jgi:hypothetical protein